MNFVECHEEPIHIPGYIQSFGYLIGIDAESHTITFFSENIEDIFAIENKELIFDKKLADFPESFQSIIESEIYVSLTRYTKRENETHFDKIFVSGVEYHFSVFKNGSYIFLEFEKVLENPDKRISNKYDNFYIIDEGQEIWEQLLNMLSKIVNYDRMMIYQFMADGSGKVIAEKCDDHMQSYLGLHYPETDIPKQARALYRKKRKRIFSDVYSPTIPLLSKTEQKIDLSFVASRGMSPIHGQYIKNTGASSSFSVSILIDDQLWGLVTCLNSEPKHIDLEDRVQAGIFTALAANAYSSFKTKKELEYRLDLNATSIHLKAEFLKYNSLFDSLKENRVEIKELVEADGLAIISDENLITTGSVPEDSIIQKIVEWAYDHTDKTIYVNRSFLKEHTDDLPLDQNTAGIIIYFIDRSKHEVLIWFRKEFDEHIHWAGNPQKKIEIVLQNGEEKQIVSPRTSFEVFSENIKGSSKRWGSRNLSAVEAIRNVILETSHQQYKIIKQLNDQLKQVNEELDSFSYTISHDLGTPLTVMKLNAQMLLANFEGSENNKGKLSSIIEEIDNMAEMMRDVLQLSRAKHSDIELQALETFHTIQKVSENAKITFSSPKSEIIIKKCPDVLADKTMLHQVFLNIINNAVKYSSKQNTPVVKIEGSEDDEMVIYRISDNGIGIPKEDQHKMFKIFNRMNNAKKFKGNGVGLSIVYRIMKRIGGKVEYESSKEETSFILTFKKPYI